MHFFRSRRAIVTFHCEARDKHVIPPPFPAKDYLPRWFRKLSPLTDSVVSAVDTGLTVKRCMPFLDAMTVGWIIPLAATVRLEIGDEGRQVTAGWDFDRTMVSNHAPHQVKGNPFGERPPCKFHNYWTVQTSPGWSCLFLNPLNRPNGIFELAAGVVDTDTYASPIHFPFFATGADGLHTIEKGSPLVQIIPFRRSTTEIAAEIRAETAQEGAARESIFRNTRSVTGWYRNKARAAR